MLEHFLTDEPTAAPHARRPRRVHYIETLLQAILHSAEDGNPTKIRMMIDTLYAMGMMPITQDDIAGFEWEFSSPAGTGSYYLADSRHLAWLADHGIAHTVLRPAEFDLAEIAFADPAAEAAFRARWCPAG